MRRLVAILLGVSVLSSLLSGSIARGQGIVHLPMNRPPSSQRAALVALHESTDGDNWVHNDNWLDESVHRCDWYGVVCDVERQQVIKISLPGNDLRGAVPPEFGNLVNLQELPGSTRPTGFGSTPVATRRLDSVPGDRSRRPDPLPVPSLVERQ